jgi:hypothetical protein
LLSDTSSLADWLENYPKGDTGLIDQVLDEGNAASSFG